MKKLFILATLLLATVMLAQTGSISGKITDIVTEQPIEGIKVILSDMNYEYPWDDSIPWDDSLPPDSGNRPILVYEQGYWEALTDADGIYKFESLTEGTYSLYVDVFPEGYDPYDPNNPSDPRDTIVIDTLTFKYYPAVYPEFIELTDGQAITDIDLALIPWGSDTCTITGKVNLVGYVPDTNKFWWGWVTVFSKSGQVIGGGFVDPFTWGDSIQQEIPGSSEYFVCWLPPVPCYVVAEAFAYTCNFDTLDPGRGEPDYEYYYPQYYDHVYNVEEATLVTPLNSVLDGVNFDLEKEQSNEAKVLAASYGSISGRILGNKGDVSYTTVYARKEGQIVTGRINKDGTYYLSLDPGTYEVYATRPGYKTGKYSGNVTVAGNAVTGINIPMVYVAGAVEQKPNPAGNPLLIEASTISAGSVLTISYSLPSSGKVMVKIYDVNGTLVRTLEQGAKTAGVHSVNWDWRDTRGSRLTSGVYFCRVEQNGRCTTKSLILLK